MSMHDDHDPHDGARDDTGMAGLQRELENLRAALAERDAEVRAMRERFEHDLLQARRELAQARIQQEQLAEQLSVAQTASTPEAGTSGGGSPRSPQRPWRAWLPRREQPRQREIALLAESDLFDADWYLAEYPDVANTGMDPAEHYLLHGASEGRNPGPEFSTHQYLFEHPDLVDSDENPLLHFLRTRDANRPR